MIRIADIKLKPGYTEQDLRTAVAKRLKVPKEALGSTVLYKRSIDARDKQNVRYVCTVETSLSGSESKLTARLRDRKITKAEPYTYALPLGQKLEQRPVVVGFGPAGIFAALILAQCGQRPIVLERGDPVEEREKHVGAFWKDAVLDTESNVQFGEGGAGTFSDGKLSTGTRDKRIGKVLQELVKAGAPDEILYEGKPHIGTDRLPLAVSNLRKQIIRLGGEIHFRAKLTGITLSGGSLKAVEYTTRAGTTEKLETDRVILAIGHSARDTFELLHKLGFAMQAKAFSVGARIEHPRELIDHAQYGEAAKDLGAADYKLAVKLDNGRGVYTFCMCPGGTVTGAASEEGRVVTNGMSAFSRNGRNSNSALLVGVNPEDYGDGSPLSGIAFQRELEGKAFQIAGGTYAAPVQRLEDFLKDRVSSSFGQVRPTYEPGTAFARMDACLPDFVTGAMRLGVLKMDRYLKGFSLGDALLTGPETRSSSPVRILRDETLQALTVKGLYPCGEGAGYAGGIMSAAVDGIKCAEAVLRDASA